MKLRVLSFFEIQEKFRAVQTELAREPLDEARVVTLGQELLLMLRLCISQMKAPSSESYPDKARHLEILETASSAITYKLNTCTVEDVEAQVNAAYRAFGTQ